MKIIKEIRDLDWKKEEPELELREAARAVLFDDQGKIPILFVSTKHYHKLPGGGLEGEDAKQTLIREVLEETGCTIEITDELGEIIEYKPEAKEKQISYCFIGKIISKGEPHFTEEEINDGFELKWMTLDEAIKTLESDKPTTYHGKFIRERDLEFLKAAQKIN